ncbi:DUF4426 domain-containing protein [Luteimonas sp. SDU101]|uniref:DUF4426 domain-containing protein n=1 Tax=Luteimonas sp. SDU101 TaxID=3422593 RepID=UPI003EB9EC18
MTDRRARSGRVLAAAALCVLAACGGSPVGQEELAALSVASRQPATMEAGGVRISASVAPTASLSPAIAARYGVAPDRATQLLLVGLRQGPAHEETSVQAQVSVRARDLRGVWQDVTMREVRSDGFVDYVGTARVAPPDTLALEVSVQREGADAPDVLRFSRDVFAR